MVFFEKLHIFLKIVELGLKKCAFCDIILLNYYKHYFRLTEVPYGVFI